MKYTTESFIDKAKEMHGDRYDYSKVVYVTMKDKVCIICKEHGKFLQSPDKHLLGQGCPLCGVEHRCDTNSFIEKARKIHGDRYDYSKVEYINNNTEVCIICKKHGEFNQRPVNHLNGKGCPICGGSLRHDTSWFIENAKKTHGDEYDYSNTNYINANTPVEIICKYHGSFFQNPRSHIKGSGCPICGGHVRYDTNSFIEKAKKIHGNKYDYSKVNYTHSKGNIEIICHEKDNLGNEHGSFFTNPEKHVLRKQGCPKCIGKYSTTENFIQSAKEMHGDKYDYSKVNYVNSHNIVDIICNKHGLFKQAPFSHLSGRGCPICGKHLSKSENEIYEYVSNLIGNDKIEQRSKHVIPPSELDIYIPNLKIGIEYNGLIWHSERFNPDKDRHLNKLLMCKEKGVRLIQIFEDEYLNNKEIVLNKIKHLIKSDTNDKIKIPGRKCLIKEISYIKSNTFLNKYHIQGSSSSSVYLGAFYNDELIGVMLFKKETKGDNNWELTRFASNYNYICQGVGGKLFKYFIRNYNPEKIKSFADRRWTINEENNLYTKIGFKKECYTKPDYRYYSSKTGCVRIHKFNMRKVILHKKYGLPLSMSENEMTRELGYTRIWDCGLIKYIWNKK